MNRLFVLTLSLALSLSGAIQAAAPQMINFQGLLADDLGDPVADSSYTVSFTIYDDPVAGTSVWTETLKVTTSGGNFSVLLGSLTPILDTVFNGITRYLGIAVGGDPEMTPRTALVSVPYAHRVNTIDGARGGNITSKVSIGSGHTNTGANAFIAGSNNTASGSSSTVGGGHSNTASDIGSTVGGGGINSASGFAATVGGGYEDTASGQYSTVGGGFQNTANDTSATVSGGRSNTAGAPGAMVGGGLFNAANGFAATVCGGQRNEASGVYSVVAGGGGTSPPDSNKATGDHSAVGGGAGNTASGFAATVGGGRMNIASGVYSVVAGGGGASSIDSNQATGPYSAIGGGIGNTARGWHTTVGGGRRNVASGSDATVPGGHLNLAQGNLSYAAGYRAKANHDGTFVWSDGSSNSDFASTGAGQFLVRASGGVYLYTNGSLTSGALLNAGSSSWSGVSDSTVKRNIREVDYQDVLEKVAELPISQWSYEAQDESVEHIGPMAQDFYRLFSLGEDDKHINTLDPDGVALAAIKALYEKSKRVDALEARLAKLEKLLEKQIKK